MNKTVIALSALLCLGACNDETVVQQDILRPVRFIDIGAQANGKTRSFSGVSRSAQESRLSFKVPGSIIKLPVKVGDRVRKGQQIAQLNPLQYELQLQQAEASLAQAKANARNSAAAYERVKELYEYSNASRNDLDSARALAESSKAIQTSAQNALALATLNLEYTQLTAQQSCTIASIAADLNENVVAGAEIARVNCGDTIEISLSIPESVIGGVSENMVASAVFISDNTKIYPALVTEIGAGVGSSFPITVRLLEKSANIRAGLVADVSLQFSGNDNGHIIPLSAVFKTPDGVFVYLATPIADTNTAVVTKRAVVLGDLNTNGVDVVQGLNLGDKVITAGVSQLHDGQTVLVGQ